MGSRLATELSNLRRKKGVSLRTVEAETGISNAYLSQLERGVATRPTPAKLRALADYFETPYLELLRDAGYLPTGTVADTNRLIAAGPADPRDSEISAKLADLTDDEEALVLQYAEFLKARRAMKSNA